MMLLITMVVLAFTSVLQGLQNEFAERKQERNPNATVDVKTEMPSTQTGLFDDRNAFPEASTSLFHLNTTLSDVITSSFDDDDKLPTNITALYDKKGIFNESEYPLYYDEADIERLLIENSVWVTSVPGVICNTVIIIVMSRMKPFTTNSLFILVLGITDLINVFMRMGSAMTYVIETVTDATCKAFDYVIITSFNFSNMILVCWTVERFIAVWFPLKYYVHGTIQNAGIALVISGVVMGLLTIPYPLDAYAKQTKYGFVECDYSEFLYSIWTPIESTYYIWIPILVISVSNALIVHKLVANRKRNLGQSMSFEQAQQRAREQTRMTYVLISVSLAFLVLHLPQAVATLYLSIKSGNLKALISDPFGPLKSILWCFIVTEFQNSINFFLYCLTGRDFRLFVVKMFCGCRNILTDLETMPKSRPKSARETEESNNQIFEAP